MSTPSDGAPTFFERVGGSETFHRLAKSFYAGVADDPVLRPLYAEDDLGPATRRLQMFLEQYWGGPTTYSEQRGHPRLRMRHGGWRIGEREREAWLSHMRTGVDQLSLEPADEKELWDYLVMAAYSLVNEAPAGAPLPVIPHSPVPGSSS